MDRNSQSLPRGRPVSGMEAAHANEYFEQFLNASSLKHILGYYRGLIDYLHLKPNVLPLFYPKVRSNLTNWKSKALWKKLDARAAHKCYGKGKLANNTRVLVIGGGPCGMRTAIEAQLLGAKVVVIEKRDRFSRNNVLHLWPFVIEDLRMLGAKKFFGKFCAGAIDHISIRRLQCILLKVALLLGVEVHTEVSFLKLIEPNAAEKTGWRAEFDPIDHPVSHYEFDVVIGADGKRNTLKGFTRKEFRGKLAIAITANFINKKTEAEARVEEISGVAFIFNQKFFKDLQEETRIDLENIVYYKDDTHYFVMTAKKASLLEKGVIKQDLADTEKLLAPENVDREALQEYAIEAASFSTNYQMSNLEFAVNHYGHPDIAMFDFTSMFAADNASKVVERNGYRLLMILVGDSLLEPFWPTGSGCARGFLSALDAAWAIRSWSLGTLTPLDVLAERESIYRLLAQTTPDNLNKDWKSYTLDPTTRYPNLNKTVVMPHQTICLYETDNPASIESMKRSAQDRQHEAPKKRRRGNVDNGVLLSWITDRLRNHEDITVTDIGSIFKDGKVLCAIIHHYRPDLLDYNAIKDGEPVKNNQSAIDLLEKELGIPPIMTGEEITTTEDYLTLASYLTQVYDAFRGEIPHIKHPKLKLPSKIPKNLSLAHAKNSSSASNKKQVKITKNEKDSLKTDLSFSKSERAKSDLSNKSRNKKTNSTLDKDNKTKYKKSKTSIKLCEDEDKNTQSGIKSTKTATDKGRICNIETLKKEIRDRKSKLIKTMLELTGGKLKIPEPVKEKSPVTVHQTEDLRRSHDTAKKVEENSVITGKMLEEKLISSRSIVKKKKLRLKKSKLSVIPETKMVTFNEETSEKSVNLSKTFRERTERTRNSVLVEVKSAATQKSPVFKEDINVYKCETIFNNNRFKSRTKSHKNVECANLYKNFQTSKKIGSKISPYSLANSSSIDTLVKIRLIEKKSKNRFTYQKIEFVSSLNLLRISSKASKKFRNTTSQHKHTNFRQFPQPKNNINSDTTVLLDQDCPKHFEWPEKLAAAGDGNFRSNYSNKQILNSLGGCEFFKNLSNYKCHTKLKSHKRKFLSKNMTMMEGDAIPDQIYSRVSNWISTHDFKVKDGLKPDAEADTLVSNDIPSDITSVTRNMAKRKGEYDDVIVEERTNVIKCCEYDSPVSSEEENFSEMIKNINEVKSVKTLSKFSQYSPLQNTANLKSASAPPAKFSIIVEGEEPICPALPSILELPESNKRSELSFKTIKTSNIQQITTTQPSRPSSRHKRHADAMIQNKPSSIDRKMRKRRTLEKVGASVEERQKMLEEIASNRAERQNKRRAHRKFQTEQFVKSMQMLQANAKPDAQPFEDYSIFLYRQNAPKFEDRVKDLEKQFTYVPDHENKIPNLASRMGGTDEDLAARIKSLEDKWREPEPIDKKPKDLLRAIGKIETSDWNIKEIEKKILENKMGKPSKVYDKEKVPKWSKEQFLARQTKMEKQHYDRQDSAEAKYADIDRSIKHLDLKLKEGTIRELGQNKVASITEKLVSKVPTEPKPVEKNIAKPPVQLPAQGPSEYCHFCDKRVYLMERLSAEGRFFHHGCFKCQFCNTQLRLGSYAFDRDGMYGHKFFCLHHFGMVAEPLVQKVVERAVERPREARISPDKKQLSGVAGLDLLDRVQTPERISLSTGNISSEQEDSLSQMDEDEWTDKNFGASCAEAGESDDDSSSLSDTDSDDEDAFEEALEEPVTKEGTMKWAERWKNSYSRKRHDSDSNGYSSSDQSSYYENSSDDDESDTATEGEEEIRARELRKQEVRVEPPVVQTDTGTDTEVKSSFNLSTEFPDILSSHNRLNTRNLNLSKSSDNISVNSGDYNSAESGDLDLNMNKTNGDDKSKETDKSNIVVGKLTIAPKADNKVAVKSNVKDVKSNPLAKSATSGALVPKKVVRNFVLPPRESRKSFGAEFVPKFKSNESEPLLIIKRTPSKISLPKEVGKPKVAVNTNVVDTKKYFGEPTKKPPIKKTLQRSGTTASVPKSPLVKQKSLPETSDEIKDVTTFNFEPEDLDIKEIDNYIEDLIANEEELHKPIDPKKYSVTTESPEKSEDEKVSSSIEDLLKALETETRVEDEELEEKPDEKMEDLLTWMEGLDHQTKDRKVYRSYSDAKYKNLETVLKTPQRSDSIVSKIPRNNLTFFELHLAGKGVPRQNTDSEDSDKETSPKKFGLARSKTEIHFKKTNRPRSSVDLDAVNKVDIKKMLQKFESTEQENDTVKEKSKSPVRCLAKRNSFANLRSAEREATDTSVKKTFLPRPRSIKNTINKFESEPKEFKKPPLRKASSFNKEDKPKKSLTSEPSIEDTLKDLEKFVEDTIKSIGNKYEPKTEEESDNANKDWCVNITVSTIPNYEQLQLQSGVEQNCNKVENVLPEQIQPPSNVLEVGKHTELKVCAKETDLSLSDSAEKDNKPQAHDFSKAVESTDTSVIEDPSVNEDTNAESLVMASTIEESSLSDEYKVESQMPHDFSKAVADTTDTSRYEEKVDSSNKDSDKKSKTDNSTEKELNKPHDFKKAVDDSSSSSTSSYSSSYEEILINDSALDAKNAKEATPAPKISGEDLSEVEENGFLKIQKRNESPKPEPPVNINDLYAKVDKNNQNAEKNVDKSLPSIPSNQNKQLKESTGVLPSPQVPWRLKKPHTEIVSPPQRPMRQKSFERASGKNSANVSPVLPPKPNKVLPQSQKSTSSSPSQSFSVQNHPIAPQRKRASTVSPLPSKSTHLKPINSNEKRHSSGNLDVKKEVVNSFNLPKPQSVLFRRTSTDSSSSANTLGDKPKDKEKDCCIQ